MTVIFGRAEANGKGGVENITGNLEVMQRAQPAACQRPLAFARYALGRDSPNNPSLATPSATTY
jgi:hypothetical protein